MKKKVRLIRSNSSAKLPRLLQWIRKGGGFLRPALDGSIGTKVNYQATATAELRLETRDYRRVH